jgi:hypothetical protein
MENQQPRNWLKIFIKASGPAYYSFAVLSGEINLKTGKNQSMGPSVSFHWTTEAKKIMFSASLFFPAK